MIIDFDCLLSAPKFRFLRTFSVEEPLDSLRMQSQLSHPRKFQALVCVWTLNFKISKFENSKNFGSSIRQACASDSYQEISEGFIQSVNPDTGGHWKRWKSSWFFWKFLNSKIINILTSQRFRLSNRRCPVNVASGWSQMKGVQSAVPSSSCPIDHFWTTLSWGEKEIPLLDRLTGERQRG